MKEPVTTLAQDEFSPGIRDGHALLHLARGWLKQGNPIVAIELLRPAIQSNEAERDQELRANILKETGRASMMQSDWQTSESYFLEAQRVYLGMEHYQGAAECARNRANMHFQKGNYQVAEELCEQALDWASAIRDYELRATILNTLGAIKSATGNHVEAVNTFRLCLSDFCSSGNRIRQGYVLLNIGLAQTELGSYREALESLNQSLAISHEEKDLSLVEICYQNISKCYLAQGETILAKSVLDTARQILPGLNSTGLECELNLIDGTIMRVMGDFQRAEQILEDTYAAAVDNGLTALTADVSFEQGLLARDRGDFELAISKLDAAANRYKLIGVDKGFKEAVRLLEQLKRKTNA